MWYLSFCAALVGAVLALHRLGPDEPCHPADDRVLRIHAVGEEEGQVGGEVVDGHAPGQVVLHQGESVGQGEGELADRIRARLGDVVTR